MPGREINVLTLGDLAERVAKRLVRADRGSPAYTLILGSGFSYPLIPTARGMVERDVAWWLFRRERGETGSFPSRPGEVPELDAFEKNLWADLHRQSGEAFDLDGGFPSLETSTNISRAYCALMSSSHSSGLSDPSSRRGYFRDVVRRVGNRINPAHLLLADLLAEQDRPQWSQHRAAFCRTIFTTNIDPLLQRSLQLCQKLYFMTDQPDDLDLPDDEVEQAAHLVYAHGSVHRYRLVNSGAEIGKIRERARLLSPYFRKHGAIVLGYSGWEDVILEALRGCPTFEGNLYWCDLHPHEEISAKLNESVLGLLGQKNDSAFYVQVPSAEEAVREIRRALKLAESPELIVDPFRVMTRTLESVELTQSSRTSGLRESSEGGLTSEITSSLRALAQAGLIFRDEDAQSAIEGLIAASRSRRSKKAVEEYFSAGDYEGAVHFLSEELGDLSLPREALIKARFNRGLAHSRRQDLEAALADLNAVSEYEDLGDELKLSTLVSLSVVHQLRKDYESEISAINSIFQIDGLDPDVRAFAFVQRGISNGMRREHQLAIDDFTSALSAASSDSVKAQALFERGLLYRTLEQDELAEADFRAALSVEVVDKNLRGRIQYQIGRSIRSLGKINSAIEEFHAVIQDESIPGSVRALAHAQLGYIDMGRRFDVKSLEHFDRALAFEDFSGPARAYLLFQRGNVKKWSKDLEGAINDLTLALDSQDLNSSESVRALLVRAQIFIAQGQFAYAVVDLDRAVNFPEIDAPFKLEALEGRGIARLEMELYEEASEDFNAILLSREASQLQIGKAYFMLGVVKGEGGLFEEAVGNFSLCINSGVLPDEVKAEALTNRAALYIELNRISEARDDLRAVVNLESAAPKLKANALGTLGWHLLVAGDLAMSRSTTEAAISILPADAGLRFNLGLANLLLGEPEKARAAYDEGSALASSDEFQEALEDLDQAAADHGHLEGANDIVTMMRQRVAESSLLATAVDQPLNKFDGPPSEAESDLEVSEIPAS